MGSSCSAGQSAASRQPQVTMSERSPWNWLPAIGKIIGSSRRRPPLGRSAKPNTQLGCRCSNMTKECSATTRKDAREKEQGGCNEHQRNRGADRNRPRIVLLLELDDRASHQPEPCNIR